jgi:hypothetical protein
MDTLDEESKRAFSLLADYTPCLAIYQGEGSITLHDQRKFPCTFEVGQLKKGNIFFHCDASELDAPAVTSLWNTRSIDRFEGTSKEGFHLTSTRNIISTNLSPLTFIAQDLYVEMSKDAPSDSIRFGITNFVLSTSFSLRVEHESKLISIQFQPISRHEDIIERMRNLKITDVTCEIIISLSEIENEDEANQIVDNLCYLLSVAKGTKIQWIYRALYNEAGACISKTHASRITKVYGVNLLMQNDRDVEAFLEITYSGYVANRERYKLDTGTIDAYLDAKAESDFLQVRGIKLAVTMEIIKEVFTGLAEDPVQALINKPKIFEKLKKKLFDAIMFTFTAENIEIERDVVREKLPDLNRKAFRGILNDIFKRINLQIADEDMDYLIKCRNQLVHTGRFLCEKDKTPTQEEMVQEYSFLVHIVDSVYLKLLGYHGEYRKIDLS